MYIRKGAAAVDGHSDAKRFDGHFIRCMLGSYRVGSDGMKDIRLRNAGRCHKTMRNWRDRKMNTI